MMLNLWSSNNIARFWQCQPEPPDECWQVAIQKAMPVLGLSPQPEDENKLLALILGEGQFGPNHWQLSLARRIYYELKPLLPRKFTHILRRAQRTAARDQSPLGWPIEDRYARFQWEVMRQLLLASGQQSLVYRCLWPEGNHYAFILTHDVETAEGQAYIRAVVDLEESYGFRSSFNFVPERYPLDMELIEDLRKRGFEIGIHGLRHDGKLFKSYAEFVRRSKRINAHLNELDAVGFRSPLMLRNPEWLQMLEIEYDLSFFDTDPFEPIPGGVMSIWPFIIGRFVELPYTLVQDHTLTVILGEKTTRLWLEKVEFIERYQGMALVNTHPDYLVDPLNWQIYADFLHTMKSREGYWHVIPRQVADWWRARLDSSITTYPMGSSLEMAQLTFNG
jgi:peptidoglycan/xylan/chitin deacetylase (PgdA/CDA1 family)